MSSDADFPIPETRVLAVASHVVYGYVGNTMATFVMQSLGCEVAAINTVNYSNHLGYGQCKGSKTSAQEITDLYQGLKDSYLDDFQMMLSGYLPSASTIEAVGNIARHLKYKSTMKPGGFFWILDPVMGDNGKLYVSEDVVPAFKSIIRDADLILPNQFEAEVLSGVKIVDMDTLKQAITTLHELYRIPHIMITSISFPEPGATPSLSVVGSTFTSTGTPRIFEVKIPRIDGFYSGTGDMFAALMLVRFREAVYNTPELSSKDAWVSGDDVVAADLPLAQATEKVLASMHIVLTQTKIRCDEEMEKHRNSIRGRGEASDSEKQMRLVESKAAEVRLVRNLHSLRDPEIRFKAEKI